MEQGVVGNRRSDAGSGETRGSSAIPQTVAAANLRELRSLFSVF
jgi:hypothetical protein